MKNFFDLVHKPFTAARTIRAFRKNFRITQAMLSQVTGVSVSQLSAIENERAALNVKQSVLIAAALGIEPSQLLFPDGTPRAYAVAARRVQKKTMRMLSKQAS